MAFGLPSDQRGQVMVLLAAVALAGIYVTWTYGISKDRDRIGAMRSETDSLQRIVDAGRL